MSLEMCVLGSGSSGNATVLRAPQGVMLIDAGFGPRATASRLYGLGVELEDISAICLTHLDHDHFNATWFKTIAKRHIRVYCHARKARQIVNAPEARALLDDPKMKRAGARPISELVVPFSDDAFEPIAGVTLRPFALAHDDTGSHGFVAECGGARLGFATDLGHVPDELVASFCGVDVLAIESNYDVDMEHNSDRPWFLKKRIMGGAGHLSNDQALAAVRAILDRCEKSGSRLPRHIVLLHRSRQCNCPDLLRRLFSTDARIASRLTLTHQYERTAWLGTRGEMARTGEQLILALG